MPGQLIHLLLHVVIVVIANIEILRNQTGDAIRMLKELIEELDDNNIFRDDIIGVFLQLKNKKIINKKLNSLLINKDFNRAIRNSKQAFHLLDDLINKRIIIESVTLQKSSSGFILI